MNQTPASPEPPRSGLARTAQTAAGTCAAIALASIMFLMLIDVTGRYLFNAPLPGAAEIIELAMGVCVFAALPLVTASNEHIRLVPQQCRPRARQGIDQCHSRHDQHRRHGPAGLAHR